jgi:hypothetical protein
VLLELARRECGSARRSRSQGSGRRDPRRTREQVREQGLQHREALRRDRSGGRSPTPSSGAPRRGRGSADCSCLARTSRSACAASRATRRARAGSRGRPGGESRGQLRNGRVLVTKTPSSSSPASPKARSTHQAVSPRARCAPRRRGRRSATGPAAIPSMSKSLGIRKSRSRRVAKRMSPRMRETRNVRMSSGRDPADHVPAAVVESSAYGLTVRSPCRSRGDRVVRELDRALLRDRASSFRAGRASPASSPGRDLDAHGRLVGARRSRAAEREVLEREPQRLRIGELPSSRYSAVWRPRARRRRARAVEEVVLGAERVELLAGELVALGLERDAEGDQLGRSE